MTDHAGCRHTPLPYLVWLVGRLFWMPLLSAAIGCGPSTAEPAAVAGPGIGATGSATDAADTAAEPREYWQAQFLQGSKVGYSHTHIGPFEADGRRLIRLTSKTQFVILRNKQSVAQELVHTSVETPDGEVVRFDTSHSDGGIETVATGQVRGNTLHVEMTTTGRGETREIPWDEAAGGFFAVEQSLERKPLQPGEQRELRVLVPIFLQIAEVDLEAFACEMTPLLAGQRKLLRIKKGIRLGPGMEVVEWIWCDDSGQIWKSQVVGGLGGDSYLTTKEIAIRKLDDVAFDLMQATTVKVNRPLDDPHHTRRVVYLVRMDDGDPQEVFADEPGHLLERIDGRTAKLTVGARGLEDRVALPPRPDAPSREDRVSNSLIQSDDDRIVRLAKSVEPDETDASSLAAALERFVGGYIIAKDFSRALASAAEVAHTRQGDCTEHAVLLAAMCRARGLPARVAIGLVYSAREGGFAYHMWDEVWIDDRWVPLDATLCQGGIGAAHVKLRHTNLHGVGPYAAFLPVYQVLGRLDMEILEVEQGE